MADRKLFEFENKTPKNTDKFAFGMMSSVNPNITTGTSNITLSALRTAITGTTAPVTLLHKTVCIGNWVMCGSSAPSKNVSLGVCLCQIRSVDVLIRSDGNEYFPIVYPHSNEEISGKWMLCCSPTTNATISLSRKASYFFDSSGFNCPSWNRGWVTISYIP